MSDRAIAIAAVAMSRDLVTLQRQECPLEPLYDLARTVVDTAEQMGVSYIHATDAPHLAVGATRKAWATLPEAKRRAGVRP